LTFDITSNVKIRKNEPLVFAFNQVCAACIQAGVGHLKNVYKDKDASKRREWRKKVRDELQKELEKGYSGGNVKRIEQFRLATADTVLQQGKLTFGVAQKILNLFLKYCWSLGWSVEPKDCPIDSRILGKLWGEGERRIIWSTMDQEEYEKVMEKVDKKRKKRGDLSRAMWEFKEWEESP